jgi:hypothetical protein
MLYLSLTTRPERLTSEHFKKVYYSLKNQTYKFTHLIINLSISDFVYNSIPQYLQDDKQIIINKTKISGPCTKLIGSIDIIPNDAVVIILDDDIVMKPNFISSLYGSYKKTPSKISSSIVIVRKYFTDVVGFAGFIFRMTDIIRELKNLYSTMPACAKYIDDTWFGWCFWKLGLDVIKGKENDPWNNILDIPNTDPHPEWHELCKHTNRNKLINEFLKLCNIQY